MSMEQFLQMFETDHDEGYLLVWTLPDKQSRWVSTSDIASAKGIVDRIKKGSNVYVGVGISPEDYGPKLRCSSDKVKGLAGLWIDIDIQGPAHKKKNLPPNETEALDLVRSIGVMPTWIIHSGNGVQAWWQFREPWMFDNIAEQQDGATLAGAWNNTFRILGAQKEYDVDATHDLSRVMRVPDTYNYKTDPPKEVRVIEHNPDLLYNPSELEEYVVDREFLQTQRKRGGIDVVLNKEASPPLDRFDALMENEPKARESWERSRRDLQDQSPSAYDMSLAMYAISAGWSDQETCDLIIASRRKHNSDLKLRLDYYDRTLNKARSAVAQSKAEASLDSLVDESEQARLTGTALEREEARQKTLQNISNIFRVNILRVVKFLSDPPQYRLETSMGNIMIGEAKDLMNMSTMRSKILAVAGVVIKKYKGPAWDNIVQQLADCCEEESAGEEATEGGTLEGWLVDYLLHSPPTADIEIASVEKLPLFKDENVYIFMDSFKNWIVRTQMEKISSKRLGIMLRNHGCESQKLDLTIDDRRTSKSVWQLPQEFKRFIEHEE